MASSALNFVGIKEEANGFVREICEKHLKTATYDPANPKLAQVTTQWADAINEEIVAKLSALNGNFKYIVSTSLVQKNGAGLNIATRCFWDDQTDGSLFFRYENKTLTAVVSVFGVAL
mmetsp:Transcript_31628/g.75856  ORF Transcript_31628/g.75856 Transcript_31628/m.75856 type:complete len:118 (+) Transcript_31628:14-367(+)